MSIVITIQRLKKDWLNRMCMSMNKVGQSTESEKWENEQHHHRYSINKLEKKLRIVDIFNIAAADRRERENQTK